MALAVEPATDADLGADPILIPNPGDPLHSVVLSDVITRLGHLGQPDFRILFVSDGDPFFRSGINFL